MGADPGGDSSAGSRRTSCSGTATGFAAAIDLAMLDGTNGFRLDGVDANDCSGRSVSSAGDVNGDGFDDLLIGPPWEPIRGGQYAGSKRTSFSGRRLVRENGAIDLATLNGMNGFRLDGVEADDYSGRSVSGAGTSTGTGSTT